MIAVAGGVCYNRGMKITLATIAVAATSLAAVNELNWNIETYEPRTPVITGSVASGFHGSVAPMTRVNARTVNSLTDANRDTNIKKMER